MKKRFIFSLVIVVLASLFASQKPDGLDKVSEIFGFSDKAVEGLAIMHGYHIHFFGMSKLSAILAGIIGVMIVYGLFWLCISLTKKSSRCAQ